MKSNDALSQTNAKYAAALWANRIGCAEGALRPSSNRCSLAQSVATSDNLLVIVEKKDVNRSWGFCVKGKSWLFPEEAAFLVERGHLKIFDESYEQSVKEELVDIVTTIPVERVLANAWKTTSWIQYRSLSQAACMGLIVRRRGIETTGCKSTEFKLGSSAMVKYVAYKKDAPFKRSLPGLPSYLMETHHYETGGFNMSRHMTKEEQTDIIFSIIASNGTSLFFNVTSLTHPETYNENEFLRS